MASNRGFFKQRESRTREFDSGKVLNPSQSHRLVNRERSKDLKLPKEEKTTQVQLKRHWDFILKRG